MSDVDLPPKVCPSCRVEYLHTAETCSDCGVDLVLQGEAPEAPAGELPPAEELVMIRAETATWIEGLGRRLEAAEIPFRIEVVPQPASRARGQAFALFVLPEDEERARQIDAKHLRTQLPDLPDAEEGAVPGTGDGEEACPACGTGLPTDASECPECGLCFEPHEG